MPTPLTTSFIAAGAVLLPLSEVAGAILASLGLGNQLLLTVAAQVAESRSDDGLG